MKPETTLFVRHGKDLVFQNHYDHFGNWKGCQKVTVEQMREYHRSTRKKNFSRLNAK